MGLLDNDGVVPKKIEAPASNPTPAVNNVSAPKNSSPTNPGLISQDEILGWFKKKDAFFSKKVCMVLGEDGTGKSGLVMHHIAEQLKKDPTATAVVLDLDQGCGPLMEHYQDIADRLIVKDPIAYSIEDDGNEVKINWIKLMSVIMKTVDTINKNREQLNVKFFVLDGLSKLLEIAENQMRLDTHKTVDQGVQTMYWKKRKEYFFRVLDVMKSLPIDTFYIGHTNFILSDGSAAVQTQTNAMVWQRIICSKEEKEGVTKLVAKITKSKLNPLKENAEVPFMILKDGQVKFNSTKVFEGL